MTALADATDQRLSFRERGRASVANADDRLLRLLREGWALQDAGWPPVAPFSFRAPLAFLVDERRRAWLAIAAVGTLVGALALSSTLGIALPTVR